MSKDIEGKRNRYAIPVDGVDGEVTIADEVVATIASLAAMEVDGVASMAGNNATRDMIAKIGIKSLMKGIRIDMLDGVVTVSLALNLKYGCSIPEVSGKVQERVKNAVQNMAGLEVSDVNIRIVDVEME